MSGFEDREKAFENKYAHEEKLNFEVEARASKLFGLWVATKLGLDSNDAKTYAQTVVETNMDEPGFGDILRKVQADLTEKKVQISDHMLRLELDKFVNEAKAQIKG